MPVLRCRKWRPHWLLAALLAAAVTNAEEQPIHVTARPAPVYQEATTTGQAVNCDFVVENVSGQTWVLQAIELSVYDAAGKLEIRKSINDNGNSPGIATLNERELIEHGAGEYALYGHLRQASATVTAGQSVRQGERIAAIGASGSALMPHLHFQLQTAASVDADGLPSRFDAFRRLLGGRAVPVARGPVDSGDIVEDAGHIDPPPTGDKAHPGAS